MTRKVRELPLDRLLLKTNYKSKNPENNPIDSFSLLVKRFGRMTRKYDMNNVSNVSHSKERTSTDYRQHYIVKKNNDLDRSSPSSLNQRKGIKHI